MTAFNRQVRVFISSTFRDMHAERDHLVTVVFPELRERVEQLGLEFFDVDLRWGVPTKDANGETANSWEYCRQWIDRVEPFFVCILGQRYGWVPEPEQLKATEDRRRQQVEPRSITDLEVRHAVLNTTLKRHSYFYLRATDAPATASEYVDPPLLLRKLEQLKKEVRACGRPVRDYPCVWTGSGFADMNEFGRRVLDDLWSGVLRDERYVSKTLWCQALGADPDSDIRYTDESQPVPPDLAEKLVTLAKPTPLSPLDAEKQQMEAFAQGRLRWFQGRMHELGQLTDFIKSTDEKSSGLAVVIGLPGQGKSALLAKLSTLIPQGPTFTIIHFVGATERSASSHAIVDRLLGELDRSGIAWPTEPQDEVRELKRDFSSLCLKLGRRLGEYAGDRRIVILLDALNQLSDGQDLRWLPIRLGPSVRVIVSCIEDSTSKADSPGQRVSHAIDSRQPTPLRVTLGPLTENDVRSIVVAHLLEYCHELDGEHLDVLAAIPQARNPLYLLVMLTELRTLGGNDLNRIVPARIASMQQDHPDPVSLFKWVLLRLEVFSPVVVRWWCLYLAYGRVGMASHELVELLVHKVGPDAAAITLRIERGLRRYLQRRGPQIDFFHSQLRQAVFEQYGAQAEPAAVHQELADFFTSCAKGSDSSKEWETDRVRGFSECLYHYLLAGNQSEALSIITNFSFLLNRIRNGLLELTLTDFRVLFSEHPGVTGSQLRLAQAWFRFLSERAHILRRSTDVVFPFNYLQLPELDEVNFSRAQLAWPAYKILLQLAVEHADDSPITKQAEIWLRDGKCNWAWFRSLSRPKHINFTRSIRVFEGSFVGFEQQHSHCHIVVFVEGSFVVWNLTTGECIRSFSPCEKGISDYDILEDGKLLSSFEDTLYIWDASSSQCVSILQGHREEVFGVAEMPNGRIASWSRDGTFRLWDRATSECSHIFATSSPICSMHVLDNDRILLETSESLAFVCNAQTGEWLHTVAINATGYLYKMQMEPGVFASGNEEGDLDLWNFEWKCSHLGKLRGHSGPIRGAVQINDGRILSWSDDKTLRLWHPEKRICLLTMAGHNDGIGGAIQLRDGRIVSWSYPRLTPAKYGADCTVRIWDSESGRCEHILEAHSLPVNGVQELKSRHLISWAEDFALCVWDIDTGECVSTLIGHTGMIRGVAELPSGDILSWAADGRLHLWNGDYSHFSEKATATHLAQLRDAQTLRGWDKNVSIRSADKLDQNRIIARYSDDSIKVWDVGSGELIQTPLGESQTSAETSLDPDCLMIQLTENRKCQFCFYVDGFLGMGDLFMLTYRPLDMPDTGDCDTVIACWRSDYSGCALRLSEDGTALCSSDEGRVRALALQVGHKRVNLLELSGLIMEGKVSIIHVVPKSQLTAAETLASTLSQQSSPLDNVPTDGPRPEEEFSDLSTFPAELANLLKVICTAQLAWSASAHLAWMVTALGPEKWSLMDCISRTSVVAPVTLSYMAWRFVRPALRRGNEELMAAVGIICIPLAFCLFSWLARFGDRIWDRWLASASHVSWDKAFMKGVLSTCCFLLISFMLMVVAHFPLIKGRALAVAIGTPVAILVCLTICPSWLLTLPIAYGWAIASIIALEIVVMQDVVAAAIATWMAQTIPSFRTPPKQHG